MLRIRLQRRGKKNHATYRVVVAESSAPIKGRFVADVGYYNPHTDDFVVDTEAVQDWLKKGAQATPTVYNQLVEQKLISGQKTLSWKPKAKDEAEAGSGA